VYDIDSIQVLKGPQGTLFGWNTTGGAVLITPVRPKLGVTEGFVTGVAGNYWLNYIVGGYLFHESGRDTYRAVDSGCPAQFGSHGLPPRRCEQSTYLTLRVRPADGV